MDVEVPVVDTAPEEDASDETDELVDVDGTIVAEELD